MTGDCTPWVTCIPVTRGSNCGEHVPPTVMLAVRSGCGGAVAWIVAVRRGVGRPVGFVLRVSTELLLDEETCAGAKLACTPTGSPVIDSDTGPENPPFRKTTTCRWIVQAERSTSVDPLTCMSNADTTPTCTVNECVFVPALES